MKPIYNGGFNDKNFFEAIEKIKDIDDPEERIRILNESSKKSFEEMFGVPYDSTMIDESKL